MQNTNISAGQSFGSVIFVKASAVSSKQEVWFPVAVRTESARILDDGLQFPEGLGPGVLQTQGRIPTTNEVGMDGT